MFIFKFELGFFGKILTFLMYIIYTYIHCICVQYRYLTCIFSQIHLKFLTVVQQYTFDFKFA